MTIVTSNFIVVFESVQTLQGVHEKLQIKKGGKPITTEHRLNVRKPISAKQPQGITFLYI